MNDQFFRRLLDNVGELIWAIDMEGRFIYINNQISEWGYDKAELIGKPLLSILNTQQFVKRYEDAFGDATRRTYELEVMDKLGKSHNVIVSSSPFHNDEGEIIGVMGLIRDITENQKLQEKLIDEERLASLGRLAIGIAHEIRNPLSSIKMNLAILKQRMKPVKDDLDHFNIAQDEVAHLETVITELLEYAKPTPLDIRRQNLENLVDETINLVKAKLHEEKLSISKTVSGDIPMVLLDRSKAHQVLMNLIINAAQASKPGGAIEIKLMEHNGVVKVAVMDNGIGISEEDLKFVFDPFFTKKKSGTGLGLSIVRNIMKKHNGSIYLESAKGKGTSVFIEFPSN